MTTWLIFIKKYSGIFFSILTCLSVSACANTFDFVERFSTPPRLHFGTDPDEISIKDSIKVYFKHRPDTVLAYSFTIQTLTIGDLKNITVEIQGGEGSLTVDDEEVVNNVFLATKGTLMNLVFTPTLKTELTYTITFASQSNLNEVSERKAVLTLRTFRNYPPIARFVTTSPDQNKPFDWNFDASSSVDPDKGTITGYAYTITKGSHSHSIVTTKKIAKYSFHSYGEHTVQLVVYDNDGGASEKATKTITISE